MENKITADGAKGHGRRTIVRSLWRVVLHLTWLLPFWSALSALPLAAQENSTDSSAVILLDENEMTVESAQRAAFKKHRIIQVNKPEGRRFGKLNLYGNKFIEVGSIHGVIKDLMGKEIKKLAKKEIKKSSLIPGYILYQEAELSSFELNYPDCPYLIEYDYEFEYSSLFFWPDWYPQTDVPVLKSVYKLILKKPVAFKYHCIGPDLQPEQRSEGGRQIYLWQLENIKARIEEDRMPVESHIQTAILFTPVEFTLGDYSGSTASWNAMARWSNDMWADRYNLPPAAINMVDSITARCSNRNEIIENLYALLQNRTRYVAIFLGIGGLQPHSAESAFTNCYGDCKDLSTLMVALLRRAGISAYPALTLTRDEGRVLKDFPSDQFNHVIVCIPAENDTIWLEATVDPISAGEKIWQIEGCDVLLVKGDQENLVTTFQSRSEDNKWISKIEGRLPYNGILNCSAQIDLTGNEKHNMMSAYFYQKTSEFKEWFTKLVGRYSVNPDISKLQVQQHQAGTQPHMYLKFDGDFHNTGVFTASRILINPNILHQYSKVSLPQDKERVFPLEFDYPYIIIDSVAMHLPFGYELEAGPKPCDLQTVFAGYTTTYLFQENVLNYVRRFELKTKTIPAELYKDYMDFIKRVAQNDQTKFVFKK